MPSMPSPSHLTPRDDGVLLSVRVQPRASRNAIGAAAGGALRVRLTAPPVDDAANEALVELLAKALACPRHRVELVRGRASRHKVVKLHGFTMEQVSAALSATATRADA